MSSGRGKNWREIGGRKVRQGRLILTVVIYSHLFLFSDRGGEALSARESSPSIFIVRDFYSSSKTVVHLYVFQGARCTSSLHTRYFRVSLKLSVTENKRRASDGYNKTVDLFRTEVK